MQEIKCKDSLAKQFAKELQKEVITKDTVITICKGIVKSVASLLVFYVMCNTTTPILAYLFMFNASFKESYLKKNPDVTILF